MDKRQKLEFLKFQGAKLSFAQKTLMPYSPLLLPPPPPCWRRPVRRDEGAALACRWHARWRRCRCRWAPPRASPPPRAVLPAGQRPQAVLPLQVCAATGDATSADGSARGATPAGGAVPPSGGPCGGVFACGSSDGRRRYPAAHHPAGEVAVGASAHGLPALLVASLL